MLDSFSELLAVTAETGRPLDEIFLDAEAAERGIPAPRVLEERLEHARGGEPAFRGLGVEEDLVERTSGFGRDGEQFGEGVEHGDDLVRQSVT